MVPTWNSKNNFRSGKWHRSGKSPLLSYGPYSNEATAGLGDLVPSSCHLTVRQPSWIGGTNDKASHLAQPSASSLLYDSRRQHVLHNSSCSWNSFLTEREELRTSAAAPSSPILSKWQQCLLHSSVYSTNKTPLLFCAVFITSTGYSHTCLLNAQ